MKLKKVNRELAEKMCFKVSNEGIGYALLEGYLDCSKGTVLEPIVKKAEESLRELDNALNELREEYELEE